MTLLLVQTVVVLVLQVTHVLLRSEVVVVLQQGLKRLRLGLLQVALLLPELPPSETGAVVAPFLSSLNCLITEKTLAL